MDFKGFLKIILKLGFVEKVWSYNILSGVESSLDQWFAAGEVRRSKLLMKMLC